MKIIGITGGIGSGKSKVLDFMKERFGAYILQTDFVAHKLQKPGEYCYKKIVQEFGTGILNDSGNIDRKALGNIVFSDENRLQALNHIVHPEVKGYVKQEIACAKKNGVRLFLIESALLKEDHYEEICDELWFIFVEKEIRVQRLLASRELPIEKINKIIEAQSNDEAFRAYCDVTIDNSGEFSYTEEQICCALNEIDRRSAYEAL